MGDIDFDELDKAVNSLMSGAAGSATATKPVDGETEKPIQTLNINDKTEATPQQIEQAAQKIGAGAVDEPALKSVTLDPKRVQPPQPPQGLANSQKPVGGRFMDVMHPSSDMRTVANLPTPPEPEPTPTPEPEKPAVIDDTSINTAGDEEVIVDAPTASIVPPPMPEIEQEATATEADQPFSPFIPDAKVEKRPLGGVGAPVGAVPSPFDEVPASTPEPAPSPALPPVATPEPEATPAVTSINNEEDKVTPKSVDGQRALDTADFAKEATPEEKELQKLDSIETATSVSDPATSESMRTVESGDTEKVKEGKPWEAPGGDPAAADVDHAIYDVDAHHKSLKHPAKQRSGWLVVVAIIVIILVFAGLGVAAFFVLGPGV